MITDDQHLISILVLPQGLNLKTLPVFTPMLKFLSVRGNKQLRLERPFVDVALAKDKDDMLVSSCSAYMSIMTQQVQDKSKKSEKAGETDKTNTVGSDDKKTKVSGGGGKKGAGGGSKKPTKISRARRLARNSDIKTTKSSKTQGGVLEHSFVNTYSDTYAVSLSESLAVAYFPAARSSCKQTRMVLFCAQSERAYCREKVTEVGMCATLAAQNKSVEAFCEEEDTIVQSDICHEYFDASEPASICRPSCARDFRVTSRSRLALNWNRSNAADCSESSCEPSKIVFCNRDTPVSAESSCDNKYNVTDGSCKNIRCDHFTFGSGLERHSDFIGSVL